MIESIQNQLRQIRVYGVEKVCTYLTYRDQRIKQSEIEAECFVEKIKVKFSRSNSSTVLIIFIFRTKKKNFTSGTYTLMVLRL